MIYRFCIYSQKETVEILLDSIVERVGDTPLEEARVVFMMEAIKAGKELAPIVVGKEGEKYRVLDGNHRVMASRRLGKKTIKATKESVERTMLF